MVLAQEILMKDEIITLFILLSDILSTAWHYNKGICVDEGSQNLIWVYLLWAYEQALIEKGSKKKYTFLI